MLTFKPVAQRDLSRLRRYYKDCNYQLCEYSALVKLMWRGHLHPQYAEAAGCLIVKNCIDGKPCFDYPVPGPDGDEEAALCAIEDYCVEQGISLELSVVPKEKAAKLLERYPRFHLNNFRSWRDYLRGERSARVPGPPLQRPAQPCQQIPQALSRGAVLRTGEG